MDREDVKDELVEEAKRVIDEQMTHREKLEKASMEKPDERSNPEWSEQEVEFLKNNRNSMSNEELEEFMKGEKDFQQDDWAPFSRTEERYIIQSYGTTSTEKIAEGLDRDVEQLKKKIRMMGLEV
jgi:signal recognition particle GTPase